MGPTTISCVTAYGQPSILHTTIIITDIIDHVTYSKKVSPLARQTLRSYQ